MSQSQTRYLLPIRDTEIVRVIKALRDTFPNMSGNIQGPGINIPIPFDNSDVIDHMINANGYSISRVYLQHGRYIIQYITDTGQSSVLAKLDISHRSDVKEDGKDTAWYIETLKELVVPPIPALEGTSVEALAGFKKIETALGGAVSQFAKLQRSFAEKNEELRQSHQKELDSARAQLAEERERLESEIQKKRDEVTKIQKELDDRSNTHARRDIRREIKDVIRSSLSETYFSKQTNKNRFWVRTIYAVVLIALFSVTIFSTYSLTAAIEQKVADGLWYLAAKATISGVSFLGLALLYLRWEVGWLNQQVAFERNLASTRVDIDRASWIAESLLEWNRESPDKEMPRELIESFARRLFDWDVRTEDHQTATDSLASAILGSASRLQIGPGGAEVEVDKSGMKALKKKT